MHLDQADFEACYNQAWHGLYLQLERGDEIRDHAALLATIMFRRCVDEYRAQHPDRRAEEAVELASEVDLAGQIDAGDQIQQFVQGLRAELNEREQQAAGLCYVHGFTREEAAGALGVSATRIEHIMDRVSKVASRISGQIKAGIWCEERDSLIKAYAFGLLAADGERYQLAVDHLDSCSGCRRRVLMLRGLGAVVPPVTVLGGHLAAGAAGLAAGAGAAGGTGAAAGTGAVRVARRTRVSRARHTGHASRNVVVGGMAAGVAAVAAVVALAIGGGGGGTRSHAPVASRSTPVVTPAPPAPAPVTTRHARSARHAARRARVTHHHRAHRAHHPARRPNRAAPQPSVATSAPAAVVAAPAVPVTPVTVTPPAPAPTPPATVSHNGSNEFGLP
jgi:DNA-directed RNA polymerase specialized sigma24 family protein